MTSCLVLLLAAAPGHAGDVEAQAAEELHDRASAAYKAGQRDIAAQLWRQALGLAERWKYAYNSANVLYELGRHREAAEALATATRLGTPPEHLRRASELRAKVEAELLKTHACLKLEVTPGDALVTRDGVVWKAPRQTWTTTLQSRVQVSRHGSVSETFVWKHPPGQRYAREVVLKPGARPTLVVHGSPLGARVNINGSEAGTLAANLTDVTPITLEPGVVTVIVRHPDYHTETRELRLAWGDSERLRVDLKRRPGAEIPEPRDAELETAGWASVGVGAALAVTGAALLGWGGTLLSDLDEWSRDPDTAAELDHQAYLAEYDRRSRRLDEVQTAGWITLGVGLGATLAGAIMLLWPQQADPPPAAVTLVPGPSALRVMGEVRF